MLINGRCHAHTQATFFNAATPAAIKARQESGADADLKAVLKVHGVFKGVPNLCTYPWSHQ